MKQADHSPANKIKDLQGQLDNISSELKQTKDENANLKTKQDELEDELKRLREDNNRMRASQEPSPIPSSEDWWGAAPGIR